MPSEKSPQEKSTLHAKNKNRERYDLNALLACTPELSSYIIPNKLGEDSVDFANPVAVKLLNKALLHHYYGIENWDFPDANLCPPIPGRADYIHYVADLLMESNFGRIPPGDKVTCLDIGAGASCIYPILGVTEYNWNFIASDIDFDSIESAKAIMSANQSLAGKIDCRLQKNPKAFFRGILAADEKVDATVCNPPFHASVTEAEKGTQRKVKNLTGKREKAAELNFAGIATELVYAGGEAKFINDMIFESRTFGKNCFWFTTLVSKQSNLKGIYKALENVNATSKTIAMGTGNKTSRIVAWTFLSKEEQKVWRESRWLNK
ncbi:MAG: 23S rRNA (adenine(1618)-N(6))-methyltransferase RlmF [Flavobacterium sp.]|nr:MAG: 23S rRNA (adenine(1618)-N(6))-methyltransferase RlmF [Flavobacterium sp.]